MSEAQPDVERVLAEGRVTFLGLELLVGRDALIPRAETELLGREAIALLGSNSAPQRVVDMCCGTGNLGLAIAHRCPHASVLASDLTDGTVELARRNVERLGLGTRVQIFQGDLFEPLRATLAPNSLDLIVCNPPYISTGRLEGERSFLLSHEPREAFDGGPYGLSIHQRVIREAVTYLKPGAPLLFEFGLGQDKQLALLFKRARAFLEPRFITNQEGAPRVVIATKS